MNSSIKNYTEQGGERTVIGGELVIEEGAQISGLPSAGAVILDLQGYNLADAIAVSQDITEIVSPKQFLEATTGDHLLIVTNAAFSGMTGQFSIQGLGD